MHYVHISQLRVAQGRGLRTVFWVVANYVFRGYRTKQAILDKTMKAEAVVEFWFSNTNDSCQLDLFLRCCVCKPVDRLKCLPSLLFCTSCKWFCCFPSMVQHLKQSNHDLAISLSTGHIYCYMCGDFIYSSCIELLRVRYKKLFRERIGIGSIYPSLTESRLLSLTGSTTIRKPLEVRGLYNMGNTCYMNCVVQALVHTPLLKSSLISNQHVCQQPEGQCFLCELIKLVQKMNSSEEYALSSPQLLYLLWRLAPHLAGYRQHDAQEFFLAAHDLMHRHYQGPSHKISDKCQCIMHTAFGGLTSSKGVCSNCRHQWVSGEGEFVDVQLIVPETSKKVHLKECINEFCREEEITDYSCPRCDSKPVLRQTTFRRLPAVLVFHLKRFKLSPNGMADSTKVDTQVAYDITLDMSSYLTDSENEPKGMEASSSTAILNRLNHRYSLFAIVSHTGSMQVGHYVSYVRTHGNTWWRCDDQTVTAVDRSEVTNVEAYMLFYQMSKLI